MHTYWTKLTHLVLLIGTCILLNACQKEPEVVALDEQPQILTMTLPGIDPQNISIDQQTYTITVLLPSTLPALEMTPTFTVSQQANINGEWGTGKKAISLKNYCPCKYGKPGQVGLESTEPVRVDNLTHTSYYTIKLKGTGLPLRLKSLQSPIIYDLKTSSGIIIPVENYYGSSFIQSIAVTPTGATTLNWIGGGFCFESCADRLNEISISLSGYRTGGIEGVPVSFLLKPGLHDLDLWLADGTILHATGAIMVK